MESRAAWDRFWHFDRLSSFMSGPGAPNYGAAIASGWRDFFAALPKDARILDLCTGNGAIAVTAMETSPDFAVTGVDLAAIQPAAFVSTNLAELRRIRFIPNMPAESLSLPDASFDAVVSQYGVEYSNLDRSAPEAARVLAPGGQLRFAVHAAEGSVASDTRRSISEAAFILDDIDLTGRAIRALEMAALPGISEAESANAVFQEGLKATEERMAGAVDVAMLGTVHRLLSQNYDRRHAESLETLVGWARQLRDDIAAHRERQAALLDSALTIGELRELGERFESLGLVDVATGEQRDGGDLIAHTIAARRPV